MFDTVEGLREVDPAATLNDLSLSPRLLLSLSESNHQTKIVGPPRDPLIPYPGLSGFNPPRVLKIARPPLLSFVSYPPKLYSEFKSILSPLL